MSEQTAVQSDRVVEKLKEELNAVKAELSDKIGRASCRERVLRLV